MDGNSCFSSSPLLSGLLCFISSFVPAVFVPPRSGDVCQHLLCTPWDVGYPGGLSLYFLCLRDDHETSFLRNESRRVLWQFEQPRLLFSPRRNSSHCLASTLRGKKKSDEPSEPEPARVLFSVAFVTVVSY